MEYTKGMNMAKATVLIGAKGPADLKSHAKVINKILQMDGDKVARELPAEHQLLVDGWGRDIFLPSLVYMPEKDRLLLRFGLREIARDEKLLPMQALLISSDDHGKTWSAPIDRPTVCPETSAPGMVLSYLGNGKLLEVGEATGENTRWFSSDFGETWGYYPAAHTSSGFAFYVWDPCYSDKDPKTGEPVRVMIGGYRAGMERRFDGAKRLAVLPEEWHWKHDPTDKGMAEEWFKDQSTSNWPRMMRIDRHWTMQGEPGGVGWYAVDFEITDTGGAPVMILFGSVDGICDVFIDGEKVGEQKLPPEIMWNKPFHIPVSAGLSPGKHTMVVRVEKEIKSDTNAGIWGPVQIVDATGFDDCEDKPNWPELHALIQFSHDGGKTWPEEIEPPSWNGANLYGVNEVSLSRAANGDVIAACRVQHPKYWLDNANDTIDHYCGLGTSVSKDNGYTWSPLNILYEFGHMHPSMALMPNGDIVMTYVERMGALKPEDRAQDEDGFSRWGVEAVISRDNGQTWDLEHKYILARWSGPHHAQSTSTVLLPDGSLLTAFGSGYLSRPEERKEIDITHEVCLLRWSPDGE